MLFIDAPDALERLASIEGETWKREQLAKRESPYGFHRYLNKFRELLDTWQTIDLTVGQYMDVGDGAIYGNGGYSRFVVLADGEVVLLAWSIEGQDEKRKRVQMAGVRISDEPKLSTRVALAPPVKRHVQMVLEVLTALSRGRDLDRQFGGSGRYEAEVYRNNREQLERAWIALAEFEAMCKANEVDPSVVYAELGQPQQLSEAAKEYMGEPTPGPAP